MIFLEQCFTRSIFHNNPIVVMDNVPFHKYNKFKVFFVAKNCSLVYLPPYSPDLNPIENGFGCIKSRLNGIRPQAVNIADLKENITIVISGIGNLFNIFLLR